MTKDDIDDWLENPVTQYVFDYWNDSVQEEVETLKDGLISGSLLSYVEQARIATVHITLMRVREISFEEIDDFYNGDKEDEGTRQ